MQYDLKVTKNSAGLVYFRVYDKDTGECKASFNIDPNNGSIECATGDEVFTGFSILGELA